MQVNNLFQKLCVTRTCSGPPPSRTGIAGRRVSRKSSLREELRRKECLAAGLLHSHHNTIESSVRSVSNGRGVADLPSPTSFFKSLGIPQESKPQLVADISRTRSRQPIAHASSRKQPVAVRGKVAVKAGAQVSLGRIRRIVARLASKQVALCVAAACHSVLLQTQAANTIISWQLRNSKHSCSKSGTHKPTTVRAALVVQRTYRAVLHRRQRAHARIADTRRRKAAERIAMRKLVREREEAAGKSKSLSIPSATIGDLQVADSAMQGTETLQSLLSQLDSQLQEVRVAKNAGPSPKIRISSRLQNRGPTQAVSHMRILGRFLHMAAAKLREATQARKIYEEAAAIAAWNHARNASVAAGMVSRCAASAANAAVLVAKAQVEMVMLIRGGGGNRYSETVEQQQSFVSSQMTSLYSSCTSPANLSYSHSRQLQGGLTDALHCAEEALRAVRDCDRRLLNSTEHTEDPEANLERLWNSSNRNSSKEEEEEEEDSDDEECYGDEDHRSWQPVLEVIFETAEEHLWGASDIPVIAEWRVEQERDEQFLVHKYGRFGRKNRQHCRAHAVVADTVPFGEKDNANTNANGEATALLGADMSAQQNPSSQQKDGNFRLSFKQEPTPHAMETRRTVGVNVAAGEEEKSNSQKPQLITQINSQNPQLITQPTSSYDPTHTQSTTKDGTLAAQRQLKLQQKCKAEKDKIKQRLQQARVEIEDERLRKAALVKQRKARRDKQIARTSKKCLGVASNSTGEAVARAKARIVKQRLLAASKPPEVPAFADAAAAAATFSESEQMKPPSSAQGKGMKSQSQPLLSTARSTSGDTGNARTALAGGTRTVNSRASTTGIGVTYSGPVTAGLSLNSASKKVKTPSDSTSQAVSTRSHQRRQQQGTRHTPVITPMPKSLRRRSLSKQLPPLSTQPRHQSVVEQDIFQQKKLSKIRDADDQKDNAPTRPDKQQCATVVAAPAVAVATSAAPSPPHAAQKSVSKSTAGKRVLEALQLDVKKMADSFALASVDLDEKENAPSQPSRRREPPKSTPKVVDQRVLDVLKMANSYLAGESSTACPSPM